MKKSSLAEPSQITNHNSLNESEAAIPDINGLQQQLKISVENSFIFIQTIKDLRLQNSELMDRYEQLSEKYTLEQHKLLVSASDIKEIYQAQLDELNGVVAGMAESSAEQISLRDKKNLETLEAARRQIWIRDSKMVELVNEMNELSVYKLNAMAMLGVLERRVDYYEKYIDMLKEHHEIQKAYFESYIGMMKRSFSWKLTLPLRILKELILGRLFSTYGKAFSKKSK